jgi:hypothetical protein
VPVSPTVPVASSIFPIQALNSVAATLKDALSSHPTITPQQVLYQSQFAAYQAQLANHNQRYFEEALNLLQLLRRQHSTCEVFVTPSPPRYDFPTALLYHAETRVKGASLVECVSNDPVTVSILTTAKRTSLVLGKLPEDTSVDSVMRTRALLSLMILQGTRMTIFASQNKPRLTLVVPLGPNNLPQEPPRQSSCPPHLAHVLRDVWEGWTEQQSAEDHLSPMPAMNPELLNHIISQYSNYWKNLHSMAPPSPPVGVAGGADGPSRTFHQTTVTSGNFSSAPVQHESNLNVSTPSPLLGGGRRPERSFRGRFTADSTSTLRTENAKQALRSGSFVPPQPSQLNLSSKDTSCAPGAGGSGNKLSAAPGAAATTAAPAVLVEARERLGASPTTSQGLSRDAAARSRRLSGVSQLGGSSRIPSPPADFHFTATHVSEGEDSEQSVRFTRRAPPARKTSMVQQIG